MNLQEKAIFESREQQIQDIFDSTYRYHWAQIWNMRSIVDRGLISPRFAKIIGYKDFQQQPGSNPNDRTVHITPFVKEVWPHPSPFAVAIAVDVLQTKQVPLRIAPRKFRGIVLLDSSEDEWFSRNLEEVEDLFRSKGLFLPIYGISGAMYYPRKMSHEEIVRMLTKRQK